MDAPRYLIRPLGYVQLSINRSMYFSKKEQPIIEAKLIIEFIEVHFKKHLCQFWCKKYICMCSKKRSCSLSSYSTLSNLLKNRSLIKNCIHLISNLWISLPKYTATLQGISLLTHLKSTLESGSQKWACQKIWTMPGRMIYRAAIWSFLKITPTVFYSVWHSPWLNPHTPTLFMINLVTKRDLN